LPFGAGGGLKSEVSYNLSGQVRHQGLPVAHMRVCVFRIGEGEPQAAQQEWLASQITSARGEFSFAVQPGRYRLAVLPDNDSRFLNHFSEPLRVDSNTTFAITVATGFVVSGKILSLAGKEFTSGSVLALGSSEDEVYRASAHISPAGTYSLVLPRGTYDLAYTAGKVKQAGEADTANGDRSSDGSVTKHVNETAETVTINSFQIDVDRDVKFDLIFPKLVEYPVTIVDNVEEPIPDAEVILQPIWDDEKGLYTQFDFAAGQRTDKRGTAIFFVQAGRYRLRVEPNEAGAFFNLQEDDLTVEEGAKKVLTLSQGHRLRGQVNFDGMPQAGCTINITSPASREHVSVRTNDEGKFSAVVMGGTYRVAVIPFPSESTLLQKAERKGLAPWVKSIVIGGDTQLAIKLREGVLVSGKVLDEFEQPRRGVRVFAFEQKTDLTSDPSLLDAVNSAVTDAGGRYAFHLLPGGYKLVVHKDFEKAQEVVLPNESLVANLTWTGWYQVKFEVQGEDGRALPWSRLRCYPYSTDLDLSLAVSNDPELLPNDHLLADERGCCQITLPAGVYTFEVSPPKDLDYAQRLIRQLSINGDLNRKITLGKAVGSGAATAKAP
jgi:hypothetical protein